jgi:hypothetical protein
MAVRGINGSAVALTLVGVVLTYSGIKGKKITTTARDLIAGNNPIDNMAVDVPITGSAAVPSFGTNSATPDAFDRAPIIASGSRLTPAAIYQIARSAGFSSITAIVATAVALAESGGNPRAHNPVPPDDSYGLWQINMIGAMGPERRAAFGLSSNEQLYDPLTNARAAYAISHGGTNFRPWTTFTSGAYLSHLGVAKAAANG